MFGAASASRWRVKRKTRDNDVKKKPNQACSDKLNMSMLKSAFLSTNHKEITRNTYFVVDSEDDAT